MLLFVIYNIRKTITVLAHIPAKFLSKHTLFGQILSEILEAGQREGWRDISAPTCKWFP